MRLLASRSDKVEPRGNANSFLDLGARPLGRAPVHRLPAVDDRVETSDNLLHGRGCIVPVSEDDLTKWFRLRK